MFLKKHVKKRIEKLLERFPQFNQEILDRHVLEIIKGSSLAFGLKILGTLLRYAFILIISRRCGPKGVGIYSLSLIFLTLLGIFAGLGFSVSVLRLIPQWISEKKQGLIKQFYLYLLKITITASLVLSAVLFFFSDTIVHRLFKDSSLSTGIIIVILLLPLFVVGRVSTEILRAFKNIKAYEFLRDVNLPLIGILIFLLLSFFLKNDSLPFFSYSISIMITSIVAIWFVSKTIMMVPSDRISLLPKKKILKISSPMIIGDLIQIYMGKVDTIFLGIFCSIEDAGLYEIVFRLAGATTFILGSINIISAPKFAELYWSNNLKDLQKILKFSTRVMFFISAPVFLIFILMPSICLSLFGDGFKRGGTALVLLSFGQFFNTICGSVGSLMNMTGKQNVIQNLIILSILLNLLLDYLLIPKFGINGAAVSSMTSIILLNGAATFYVWKVLKIKTIYFPLLTK